MAIGERTWEVLVLVTLSCAACLMMFVGVSSWSELNQPMEVSSQAQGSVVEMPPWTHHDFVGREVRNVEDVGVLSKARSYLDGLVDLVGSRLGSPFGVWSGEEKRSVQELEDDNGVVATVKSFLAGIADSIKRWGQKTISPPAILHATEPLGRFPESALPPSSTLVSKLTAVVGKVMEAYYADSVVAGEAKTCSGILEEQTKKLVKSLKHELKEKLCNGELQSVNEEKFCNFYRSHPKMATLMVFSKLEVDPVGVALLRTTTSELCASSNGKLVHSVHKVEKLAQRLRLSVREVGQNGFAVHEHEHGLQASHFDVEEGHSCKDCYLQGIHSLMKDIKTKLATTCQAPTSCMAETCAFVQEHRYLTKTYLILKIRAWEIVSMACTVSCRSSPSYMFPHGPQYPQTAVSEPHAPKGPSLPRFAHGFIPRLAIEHPRLMMTDPNMPISHPAEFEGLFLRRSSMCRRLARLQAFRRAMQLRGNFLYRVGDSGLEGNGQAHLVVVVNGHPIGPGEVRGILSDLQSQMDTVVANVHSDSRPEPLSDMVLKPLFERVQTISRDDSSMEGIYRAEDTPLNVESLEQVSDKPEEEVSPESTEQQVVSEPVEGSDSTSTNNTAVERDEETSASLDGNLEESAISSEDSYEEGSRAVM